MKKPEKRSVKVKELVKRFPGVTPETVILDVERAESIARELKGQSIDRKFETAILSTTSGRKSAIDFIKKVASLPKLSTKEVYEQVTQTIWKGLRFIR